MGRRRTFKISKDQRVLPFGEKRAQTGILLYATPIERRILAVLSVLLFSFGVLYTYFVMASVAHVAEREEMSRTVAIASVEVARLETAYLARFQNITESYARSLGFVKETKRIFIEKTPLTALRDASR